MKIYDCFTFYNELELLELRLMTLYPYVDFFVLLESSETFTGKKKEFFYEKNKDIFKKYSDKIIHIKLDGLPHKNNAWENEFYSRNSLMLGLKSTDDEDYVIISDVDEIPNPKMIIHGIDLDYKIFTLRQKLFYYYVNCKQNQLWDGPVVVKKKLISTMQDIRKKRGINPIDGGGWHYSYMGGYERIQDKLGAFSETQTNTNEINNKDHIIRCLETGHDIVNRKESEFQKKFLKYEELTHPELNEWIKLYPKMIKL
jgi:beta-1,4-mannosyl-glycoprotein beta-1,4-N-acetylglucosaminyltransferase